MLIIGFMVVAFVGYRANKKKFYDNIQGWFIGFAVVVIISMWGVI